MSTRFDLIGTPLTPGVTLLEASAGTGKTYAIAGLYLRHVVEGRLGAEQILVVTFTRAATAELRRRIRGLLSLARRVASGRKAPAGGERSLVECILSKVPPEGLELRLSAALESFEQAPICTIDSFCQRVLQEHAFETQTLFDAEFAADVTVERTRLADDFWRQRFYGPDGVLRARLAAAAGLEAPALEALVRGVQNLAEFQVDPAFVPDAATERIVLEREARALGPDAAIPDELAARWASAVRAELVMGFRSGLSASLEQHRRLTFSDLRQRLSSAVRGPHGPALVRAVRRRLRVALIDEFQDTDPVQFDLFHRLFAENAPAHHLCLVGDPKQAIYSFRGADVFAYLGASKSAHRRFTLPANWRSETGLVEAINAVFGRPGANPFALPGIRFERVESRGQADATPFQEAGRRRPPLQVDFWVPGPGEDRKGAQQAAVAERVAARIAALLADPETGFGPSGEGGLRRLQPGDIAVLVARHGEALLVESALRDRGIATVRQTQERIFGTEEASQMLRLLRALAGGAAERELRAAAATPLLGWTAADLDAVGRDPARWTSLLHRLMEQGQRWDWQGFLAAWEGLVATEGVRSRLLPLPDGERRFTNFNHLAEVLQRAATEDRLGPLALVDWLERRLADPADATEDEHLLRLDRDDAAVRLVTIHASKGLEYPVVFCPFLFEPHSRRFGEGDLVAFHEPNDGLRLHADLSPADSEPRARAAGLATGEDFAERLRLVYVALTRAKHRCHLVWGPVGRRTGGAEKSPLGWLLHPPAGAELVPLSELAEVLKAHLKPDKSFADLRGQLEDFLATVPAGSIELAEFAVPVSRVPGNPDADPVPFRPRPREFRGAIQGDWRVTSYSALTGHSRAFPGADTEPDSPVPSPSEPLPSVRVPPDPFRGTGAGDVLHAVFERLPGLENLDAALDDCIAMQLRDRGFGGADLPGRVRSMVQNTLAAPLADECGAPPFRLAEVALSAWKVEVPFHLPLRRVNPAALAEVAARHRRPGVWSRWPEALGALGFDPVRGFLTGKIDLVFSQGGRFHVVDWKSNVLGPTAESYTPEVVLETMLGSQYLLQYHLYLLALDRQLRRRMAGYDPDRHLGGAWYLFVRGLHPDHPGRGVFHDTPSSAFLRELGDLLVDDRRIG